MGTGKDVKKWNPYTPLVDLQNSTTTLENRLAMLQKVRVTT